MVELLVFALPCYVIYTVCTPLAFLGVITLFEMLMDLVGSQRPANVIADLHWFTPFAVASLTAIIGLPPLVMFAKLLIQVLRGPVGDALARAMLARTLKWGALPLLLMCSIAIYNLVPEKPGSGPPWQDFVLLFYLSGLPLLIPALHLARVLPQPGTKV
ncbi:MAG: hypothetical protein ACRECY_09180 [Phyllobacterium sp.]